MQNDIAIINDLTGRRVGWLLERFCGTDGDRNVGGFVDLETGYADSRNSIYEAQHLFAAYILPEFSETYGSPKLLEKLLLHLDFMKRRQRGDGSVGLGAGGVGSANEVGFTLPGACGSYRRLAASNFPGRSELMAGLERYILRGAECVRRGFPYTSNHRWTACAGPLAVVESLFPDPGNRAKIETYLSDGMDIDADGVFFEERSPNYNMVGQWGLLYLVDYWGRRDLLELVARNLRFCLEMRQPCGEAETLFSHRQDRGTAGAAWGDYYVFKRLALELNDGVFASAADELLGEMIVQGRAANPLVPLRYLFDDAHLDRDEVAREALPERFERRFQDMPLWRFREGAIAATVVADEGGHFFDITQGTWGGHVRSDLFLDYHVGTTAIEGVKITWGTGTGAFRPERIDYTESGLQLSAVDPGWDHVAHYRPQGLWGPTRIPVDQRAQVDIERDEDSGLSVRIRIDGWDEMPVAVQLLLRETGALTLPGGVAEPLARGGRTFTAGAGPILLRGPEGSGILMEGLPSSEHRMMPDGARAIPGEAEKRCHRLVVGVFTPVDFTMRLSARVLDNRSRRGWCS